MPKTSSSTTVASRVGRLLSLIPYLASRPGVSLDELSERLGVPRAVVLEELETIMMCGVPPYGTCDYVAVHVERDRVTLRFAEHFERPVRWTLPEALALHVALEVLPVAKGGPFGAEARSLAARIEEALPGAERLPIRGLEARTAPATDEIPGLLREALERGRRVRLDYWTLGRDERTQREASPLALFEDHGAWYLAAFCHRREELRFFRIDRMRKAEVLEQAALPSPEPPAGLRRRFESWLDRPSHRVRIRFDASAAPWVRDAFGEAAVESRPDLGVDLALECRGVAWLVPWLLPFGASARVLEPEELRSALAGAARAILAAYAG